MKKKFCFTFVSHNDCYAYLYDQQAKKIDGPIASAGDVYDDSFVYLNSIENKTNIKLQSNGITTNVTEINKDINISEALIHSDSIIYLKEQNNEYDIFIYSISKNTHNRLTETIDKERLEDFDGDKILFSRSSDNKSINGLYVYELATGKESKISEFGNNARIFDKYVTFYSDFNIHLSMFE